MKLNSREILKSYQPEKIKFPFLLLKKMFIFQDNPVYSESDEYNGNIYIYCYKR